jgi:hypothetical protein
MQWNTTACLHINVPLDRSLSTHHFCCRWRIFSALIISYAGMCHCECRLVQVLAYFLFIHHPAFELALILVHSGGGDGFSLCLSIDPMEACLTSPLVETRRCEREAVQMRSWGWVVARQRSIMKEPGRWCMVFATLDVGLCWIRSSLSVAYSMISLE